MEETVNKENAYLTVFFALVMSTLLSFVMVLLAAEKKQFVQTEVAFAFDTGCQSALAEYHRELWEQYDLCCIDFSYGKDWSQKQTLGERIGFYANKNLEANGFGKTSFWHVEIEQVQGLTDLNGKVLLYHIVSYMKNKLGISLLENIKKESGELFKMGEESESWIERRNINKQRLDAQPPPVKITKKESVNPITGEKKTEELQEEIPIEDPATFVNQTRGQGVLGLVVSNQGTLSHKGIQKEFLYENRIDNKEGDGFLEEQDISTSDWMSKLLLRKYLLEKAGFYTKPKEEGALSYQLEYLIAGKESDVENLEEVVKKLLLLREAANAAHLYTNAEKRAEISAMAAAVSAVAVAPEIQPLLEISILFAWAYVESLQDVRILLDGGKVNLYKTADQWHTDIKAIFHYQSDIQNIEGKAGQTYASYLELLLWKEKEETLLKRLMNVIEMDIRSTPYNENFRLDNCISGFVARGDWNSDVSDEGEIRREHVYE